MVSSGAVGCASRFGLLGDLFQQLCPPPLFCWYWRHISGTPHCVSRKLHLKCSESVFSMNIPVGSPTDMPLLLAPTQIPIPGPKHHSYA